jgi:hypothetical protein
MATCREPELPDHVTIVKETNSHPHAANSRRWTTSLKTRVPGPRTPTADGWPRAEASLDPADGLEL